jgi:type IV pilus assembly protein PilE
MTPITTIHHVSRIGARNASGFTLIELMIVVIIIGVLAAVAYPSYQNQVRKTKRADAKSALTELAIRQEKYLSQCFVYSANITGTFPVNNVDCGAAAGLGASANSNDNLYAMTAAVTAGPPPTYVLTATAIAGKTQADDTGCTILKVNQAGAKTTGASCW